MIAISSISSAHARRHLSGDEPGGKTSLPTQPCAAAVYPRCHWLCLVQPGPLPTPTRPRFEPRDGHRSAARWAARPSLEVPSRRSPAAGAHRAPAPRRRTYPRGPRPTRAGTGLRAACRAQTGSSRLRGASRARNRRRSCRRRGGQRIGSRADRRSAEEGSPQEGSQGV